MWRRHQGDIKFHIGAARDGSFVTCCDGRWSLKDEIEGLIEHVHSPEPHERCAPCEVKVLRAALDELADMLHVAERELSEKQELLKVAAACPPADQQTVRITAAFLELLDIAQAASRRGLLSVRDRLRVRELTKVVPQ